MRESDVRGERLYERWIKGKPPAHSLPRRSTVLWLPCAWGVGACSVERRHAELYSATSFILQQGREGKQLARSPTTPSSCRRLRSRGRSRPETQQFQHKTCLRRGAPPSHQNATPMFSARNFWNTALKKLRGRGAVSYLVAWGVSRGLLLSLEPKELLLVAEVPGGEGEEQRKHKTKTTKRRQKQGTRAGREVRLTKIVQKHQARGSSRPEGGGAKTKRRWQRALSARARRLGRGRRETHLRSIAQPKMQPQAPRLRVYSQK